MKTPTRGELAGDSVSVAPNRATEAVALPEREVVCFSVGRSHYRCWPYIQLTRTQNRKTNGGSVIAKPRAAQTCSIIAE